jgi:hypothetical protein
VRYIDSGDRNPSHALGHWLQSVLTADISELRWQSGFFSADGLAPLLPTLAALSARDSTVAIVIGSNDGETLKDHVAALATHVGLPRANARLGVVNYSGAFYHPKTYHVLRSDGTQAAYVGSANLTLPGVASLHVEAGITLDTREGDPAAVLDEISAAVDRWFFPTQPGIEYVRDLNDVETLAASGILAFAPVPRPGTSAGSSGSSAGAGSRPRLQPLIRYPAVVTPVSAPASAGPATPPVRPAPSISSLTAVPQPPYPPYVLFAPGATAPTSGAAALNGASLPGGAPGLIMRLNRDSSRHWDGRDGTANISVPVPTVSTFRFGIYRGRYDRPRVEFPLETRFRTDAGETRAAVSETNIMVYGFATGETGHGDVRLLVPKPPIQQLLEELRRSGIRPPTAGDPAFLEWPTPADPRVRLTFLDRNSTLFAQAASTLATAATANQLVGQGACWLPPSLSPAW